MGDRYDNSNECTLFVGKLDYGASEDDVRDLFEKYGTVESVRIVTDRETGRSRGFGFVTFDNKSDASEAVRSCDGQEINGRQIVCNVSKPRSGGGGGGGGRRDGGGGGGRYNDRNSYGGGGGRREGGGGYRSGGNSYGSRSGGGGSYRYGL